MPDIEKARQRCAERSARALQDARASRKRFLRHRREAPKELRPQWDLLIDEMRERIKCLADMKN